MTGFADLVRAVEQATGRPGRRAGRHTRVLCPVHDDHNPSLDVAEAEDGSPLVICRACGAGLPEVAAAIGVDIRSLLPNANGGSEVVAAFTYTDENGVPLFEARRFEPGFDGGRKSFALYRPNGEKGLGDTRRVVYGLRAVRAAAESGRAVLVVEGEKHVDALSRLGLVATTNPMGAGKWRDQYAEHFRGVKRAVVLPDDDQPGREHAAKVAASLATVVPDVRVCEIWPRGETKADVLDWLAYADNEELREQAKELLVEFARAAPKAADWIASTTEFVSCHLEKDPDRKRFFTASEIASLTPNVVPWVAKPWCAEGALTEVEGKIKAAGKTTFVLAMCCATLDGEPFMSEPTARTPVVYLTEQPRTTFREGLRRAGLLERDDFSVLFRFDALDLSWSETVELAAQECVRVGAKLLVVDTLGPFAGLERDGENSAGDAQAAVAPLQIVAQREKLAVVLVRHSRKGGGEVGESGRGSSAFGGAVDLLLSVRRRGGGAPKTQRVIYTLGRFDETPDDLVVDLVDGRYVALGSEDDSGRKAIKTSLLAVLADGSSLTNDELLEAVRADLGEEAVKESTYRRVRDDLLAHEALHRVDQGKKGNPYRFQIEPDEIVSCQPLPLVAGNESEAL